MKQLRRREVSSCRKDGNGEEGVFSSFPTLTGKGSMTLLSITFLRVMFCSLSYRPRRKNRWQAETVTVGPGMVWGEALSDYTSLFCR